MRPRSVKSNNSSNGRWWIGAAITVFALTTLFICFIIYLGSEEQKNNQPVYEIATKVKSLTFPTLTEDPALELDIYSEPADSFVHKKDTPTEWRTNDDIEIVEFDDSPVMTTTFRSTVGTTSNKPITSVKPSDLQSTKRRSSTTTMSTTTKYIGIPLNANNNNNNNVDRFDTPQYGISTIKYNTVMSTSEKPTTEPFPEIYKGVTGDAADWLTVLNETLFETTTTSKPSLASKVNGGIGDASSLLSLGLLAIDLFLLHNVQETAWKEETSLRSRMMTDPDVLAMNSLFISPDRVKQSRLIDNTQKSPFQEILEFLSGGVRAAVNLSKAYKASNDPHKVQMARSKGKPKPLDCIWTLYCRNLDKTASLTGPYGFLAKMNSLGLRLLMGEFPVDKALEKLISSFSGSWKRIDCNNMFPKCSPEEAKQIVMETALMDNR